MEKIKCSKCPKILSERELMYHVKGTDPVCYPCKLADKSYKKHFAIK